MLDRLPDTIILGLIDEFPQLRLTNRRLFGLAELRSRNRVLSYFDYSDQQADEFAADIREKLNLDSWRVVERLAHQDYWFFGPEHVVESDGYPGGYSNQKKGYHAINGAPWGLYIVRWSNQYLEYTTMLRAGRYNVFLDIYAPRLRELSKTRFMVVRSPTATQLFNSSPPLEWLENQHRASLDGAESPMVDQSNDLDPEKTKLFVGVVEVGPSETSEWVDVTLRIESIDWSEPISGLVFNYLYFKPQVIDSKVASEWAFQPSEPSDGPSHALSQIYKRANERKRRWSQKKHEPSDKNKSVTHSEIL